MHFVNYSTYILETIDKVARRADGVWDNTPSGVCICHNLYAMQQSKCFNLKNWLSFFTNKEGCAVPHFITP